MKKIIKYQANDGSEWNSEDEASERDVLLSRIKVAMAPLGDVPRAVKNMDGYLAHNIDVVNQCKENILALCRELGYGKNFPAFNEHGSKVHPLSIVGRVLNDSDCDTLDRAWSRFARIDDRGWEHDQYFYAYGDGRHYNRGDYPCIEDRTSRKPQ